MELDDINVKKTFGKDFVTTGQSKYFLTMDHSPTGIHVAVFDRERNYSVCIFKGLTRLCMKVKKVEEVIDTVKKTDLVKATTWP
jgi:hypothetical protein